jgi:NAD(P)-dependent dehydrogenase (short-subunit alcohol dehydrogenase family)
VSGVPSGVLSGRVAIVTGAANGLGRAEALALAGAGASLVLNDLPGFEPAVDGAVVVPGDVGEWSTGERLVAAALEAYGRLDILVNNAGVLRDRMIFSMSGDEWDTVLRVHLRGHFVTTRFATAYWRELSKQSGGPVYGRIVNTSSEAFLLGSSGQPNYAAAKAGIAALTVATARGCARYGVRANAICPRARTAMTAGLMGPPPADGAVDPLAPEHVAPLVVYLASPAGEALNGEVFVVHGGVAALMEPPRTRAVFRSDAPDGMWTLESVQRALAGLSSGAGFMCEDTLGLASETIGFLAGAGEQGDRGGEGVQEVLPADRPEFTVAEEAGHRDVAQRGGNEPGVVVGLGEQPRAAAVAGEQERPGGPAAAQGSGLAFQRAAQVLVGRLGVPDVELDGLADLDPVADRDRSRSGVGADHAADQEVALARLVPVLVDEHTELQPPGQQFVVPAGHGRGHLAQPDQGRAPAELVDHVALGAGDDVGVADGTAALGDQRMDLGRRQVDADRTRGEHPVVEKQPALPGCERGAGHAAHDHRAGCLVVQVSQQAVGRERVRVCYQQVRALGLTGEEVAAVGAAARGADVFHGEGLDRAKAGA